MHNTNLVIIVSFLIFFAGETLGKTHIAQLETNGKQDNAEIFTGSFFPRILIEEHNNLDDTINKDNLLQLELRNIVAQEEIARSAKKTEQYALWSTISVVIGTIFLVFTILLTLIANRSAREAIAVTRTLGEAQVRAYPSVESVSITGITNKLPNISVKIRNSGNSPALRIRCQGQLTLTYQ